MNSQSTDLPPRRPQGCPSDLRLDRFLAGEPSSVGADAELRTHLASCFPCAARAELLRESQAGPEALLPSFGTTAQVLRPPLAFWRRPSFVAALAMAAGLLLLAGLRLKKGEVEPGSEPAAEPYGGLKGGAALTVYARHPDGTVRPVQSGDTVLPGEQLRFQVSTPQAAYVLVMGLDATGHVSLYAPSGPERAPVHLEGHRNTLLENSVELDDAPGTERLIAVFCSERPDIPHALAVAMRALHASGDQPEKVEVLGLSCLERSVLLRKGPPR